MSRLFLGAPALANLSTLFAVLVFMFHPSNTKGDSAGAGDVDGGVAVMRPRRALQEARRHDRRLVITRRERRMAEDDGGVSEEQRDLLDLGPTAENPGTAGPCSLAECPSVAKEVSLAGLNAVARQYPSEIWVAFGSPKDAKFIHERQGIKDAGDFTLEFQRLINYRGGFNLLGTRLPMTTPAVISFKVNHPSNMPKRFPKPGTQRYFQKGFHLYSRVHSSIQEDPYIAPTDIQESRVHFEPWSVTPSKGDWVIVFQWRTEELHPFEPMIRYSRYMDRLQGAVRDAGRPPLDESVMYYAMYGSPLDRVNEIWVPVRQEVVKALSGHAEV